MRRRIKNIPLAGDIFMERAFRCADFNSQAKNDKIFKQS